MEMNHRSVILLSNAEEIKQNRKERRSLRVQEMNADIYLHTRSLQRLLCFKTYTEETEYGDERRFLGTDSFSEPTAVFRSL